MTDCLFCKIIAGEIPGNFVHQDELMVAFKDINPQAPLHVLIVPRRHIATLNDLSVEVSHPPASAGRPPTRLATGIVPRAMPLAVAKRQQIPASS